MTYAPDECHMCATVTCVQSVTDTGDMTPRWYRHDSKERGETFQAGVAHTPPMVLTTVHEVGCPGGLVGDCNLNVVEGQVEVEVGSDRSRSRSRSKSQSTSQYWYDGSCFGVSIHALHDQHTMPPSLIIQTPTYRMPDRCKVGVRWT